MVIVDGVRTAIGRYGGSLKDINSGLLASHVIEKLLEKTNVPANKIDEVILGEVRQSTESSNVARVASLRAGNLSNPQHLRLIDYVLQESRQLDLVSNKFNLGREK